MKYNNAESTLSADITASGTSIVLKTGEGDLFPSTGYPEKFKIEHFEGGVVTKREVITVSGRTGDILTISDRASEACVQDESLATKTRTQNAFSFSSGDTISMTITEEDYNGIINDFNTFKDTTVPNTYATKDEVKKSELIYDASSTGTDDYAISISGITAYQDGMTFRVKSDVANTGACTLNVNSLGAKAVNKQQGTVDLSDGDWAANGIATLVYNSSLDVFQYSSQEATVVSTSVSSTSSDFVCGESISAGDALYVDSAEGKVYKTDASNINKIGFIGFAKSSGVLDDTIGVDTAGINSNQTGLTPGNDYYLSDTPGQISITPGTNVVKAGLSTSSTEIFIDHTKELNVFPTNAEIRTMADASTGVNNTWVKVRSVEIKTPGTYKIEGYLYGDTGSGTCYGRIYKNGTPHPDMSQFNYNDTNSPGLFWSRSGYFSKGDTLEVWGYDAGDTASFTQMKLYGSLIEKPTTVL